MKTKLALILLIIISMLLFTGTAFSKETQEKDIKKCLVVYNFKNLINENITGYVVDFPFLFKYQLYHFDTQVDMLEEAEYQKGLVNKYDYIFVLRLKNSSFVNKLFIEDISQTDKKIIWYGENPELLLDNAKIPVSLHGKTFKYPLVSYNGQEFISGRQIGNYILRPEESSVVTYGSVSNGMKSYPLILNWQNYWLMTGLDTEKIKYLIFSDVLHEIFEASHKSRKVCYLRIEDVHAFRSSHKLENIADILAEMDVPYGIPVIPKYQDQSQKKSIEINEQPEIVSALKYMQDKGGSIILHGLTHQYHAEETGEGFEFWDYKNDSPLSEDIALYVEERINKGFEILTGVGLYPIAFEAPHYAASFQAYQEISKYFSTYVGQIQTSDRAFNTGVIPYRAENTDLFKYIVPESLGYLEANDPKFVEEVLEKAKSLSVVRDLDTGFFFHPYLDSNYLVDIIEGLKDLGYEFGDLRLLENEVYAKEGKIFTEDRKIVADLIQKPQEIQEDNRVSKKEYLFFKITAYIIIAVVSLCIVYFSIKYFLVRIRTRKKQFERTK